MTSETDQPTADAGPPPARETTPTPETPAAADTPAGPAASVPATAAPWFPLDAFLVLLTLVLAFLSASFPIQSNPFWLHLAAGRYLAADVTRVGVDPFCYTTEGVLWANHAWLFDLLLYWGYEAVGGAGLVLARGLLVTLTAALVLSFGRWPDRLWLAAAVTALVVLALTPRLFLQPLLVSYLFLPLTLLLVLGGREGGSRRRLWLLVPLFALWANLDEWYVLGPLTVGLFLLGRLLEGWGGRSGVRTLALVFAAGCAACLLTPYGLSGLTLPVELAYLLRGLTGVLPEGVLAEGATVLGVEQADPEFVLRFGSWQAPLLSSFLFPAGGGLSLPALAFLVLLLGGLASFAGLGVPGRDGRRPGWPWGRFLVWCGFAVLGLCMGRLIPLFALACGPLLLRNDADSFRRQAVEAPAGPTSRLPALARLAGVLGLLGLIACAWPGWLQGGFGSGTSPYRVGWRVEENRSLRAAAEEMQRLAAAGKLRHVFNYNPDVACYTAWHAPDVKTFYDYRFGLFAGQARTLGELRWALRRPSREEIQGGQNQELSEKLQRLDEARDQVFAEFDITHVVWSDVHREPRAYEWALEFLTLPHRWTLADGDGQTLLYRSWPRSHPPTPAETRANALDFAALAFGRGQTPIDPERVAFPRPRDFWDNLLAAAPTGRADDHRARFYLDVNNKLLQYRNEVDQRLFRPTLQSLFRLAGDESLPGLLRTLLAEQFGRRDLVVPPGLSLLAVQSARRAVAADPNNPDGYRLLALAYEVLRQREEDYTLGAAQGLREKLRRVQQTAAWQSAVGLDPDDYNSHWRLADTFLAQNYLDVGLEQMLRAKELIDRQPARPGMEQELGARKAQIDQAVDVLGRQVKERREHFQLQSANMPLPEKVLFALQGQYRVTVEGQPRVEQLGLAGEALKLLDAAAERTLGEQEAAFVAGTRLQLLANLGRLERVYDLLQTPEAQRLPVALRLELMLTLGAALGRADLVSEALGQFEVGQLAELRALYLRLLPADLIGSASPVTLPGPLAAVELIGQDYQRGPLAQLLVLHALHGMLLLETGDIDAAADQFRQVAALRPVGFALPETNLADRYRRLIEAANRPVREEIDN